MGESEQEDLCRQTEWVKFVYSLLGCYPYDSGNSVSLYHLETVNGLRV
jgi:hypothetical protein